MRLSVVIVKQGLQRYYKPIQNMIAWRVKVFYNRNNAILPNVLLCKANHNGYYG